MRKLEIGTEKYTEVVAMDEPEFNANHIYRVKPVGGDQNPTLTEVTFQKGPIKEKGVNGCCNEDV